MTSPTATTSRDHPLDEGGAFAFFEKNDPLVHMLLHAAPGLTMTSRLQADLGLPRDGLREVHAEDDEGRTVRFMRGGYVLIDPKAEHVRDRSRLFASRGEALVALARLHRSNHKDH